MFVVEDDNIGKIEITGHAVNRASTRCKSFYKRYKKKGEGIYDWLTRFCFEALTDGGKESGKIQYKGILFTFVVTKSNGGHLRLVTLGIANEATVLKERKKDRRNEIFKK